MSPQFTLFDLFILIGIFQGIVTGILLLRSPKNEKSNSFLGLTVLAFSFLCTKPLLHTLDLWDYPYLRFLPNGLELAMPPLVYFYIVALTKPNFRFEKKNWLHFIPFFIAQAYAFFVYFTTIPHRELETKDRIADQLYFDFIKHAEEYILLVSFLAYLYYGYKSLREYKQWLNQNISDTSFPELKWLFNLFYLFAAMFVLLLLNHGLEVFLLKGVTIVHWHIFTLVIAVAIYYLGLRGLLLPDFSFQKKEDLGPSQGTIKKEEKEIDYDLAEKIKSAMTKKKMYLNPQLTINDVAKDIGASPRDVSQTINTYLGSNFRELVNQHRMQEVKEKLKNGELKHLSILGMALESGFNSEASFYRLFKKHTGLTPKEYIDA